jgi:hypothetical protein
MNGIPSCPLGMPFVTRFLVPRDKMEHDGNYLLYLNFRTASLNGWAPIALQKIFLSHPVSSPSKVSNISPLDFFKLIQSHSAIRCTDLYSLIQTLMEKENKQTSTFKRQFAIEPSVSAMKKDEKETFNGEPTQAARPAMDENIPDTTNITPRRVDPSAATSDTNAIKAAPADDYLTGLMLAAVLAAVTMAAFLVLLDLSVVVTVGYGFSFGTLLASTLCF